MPPLMTPQALPRVSIITPSFNQGRFIERTILSVLHQDYPNIEYIVLDALSTDETGEILERYRPRISTVIREKDAGQADAINRGLALSSGQIQAYLNADDCLASPSVVSDAVRQFAEHQVDALYGRRYRIDSDGFFLDCYPFREFDQSSLKQFNLVPQECAFWTRDIYERAGGYIDKDLQFVMDYELWLRFLEHGARFKAINKVYAYFRWHENQKSQVIWRQVCLPEVAEIQRKYAGETSSIVELEAFHESFYYGVDQSVYPHEHDMAARLWKKQVERTAGFLSGTALDCWVYAHTAAPMMR